MKPASQIESLPDDMSAMYEMFGDSVPSPDHYPKGFEHYAKLYFHLKRLEKENEIQNN